MQSCEPCEHKHLFKILPQLSWAGTPPPTMFVFRNFNLKTPIDYVVSIVGRQIFIMGSNRTMDDVIWHSCVQLFIKKINK